MTLTYKNMVYECVSAEKKPNEIVIHTGKIQDGEETVYHIYGDIDFGKVVLEGGEFTQEADRIEQLEEALDMLLSGVTE